MSPNSKRGPRSDASRNIARLLAAARELMSHAGTDVALDEVARRAGVGNATLYRHFPTRADLLVAVYSDEVADLCRYGEQAALAGSPLDALFAWLDKFVVHVATKRSLALAATEGASDRRTPLFEQWHASITATAADLVDRAGPVLRPGLTAHDVLTLASGVALASGTDVEYARRLIALLRTGFASRTAEPSHACEDDREAGRDGGGFGCGHDEQLLCGIGEAAPHAGCRRRRQGSHAAAAGT
ncbi:TetR/AcrR family transcriptional regulator [Nocardia abscessus]|uniref:TetR/AcrR family transcriptional regulator n=1 Tax=Nocardia abscessus TaxID=120957 RepID=UPI00245523CE|nr:helix-turn-helix domain-containing protein [Nocardia abscessus]